MATQASEFFESEPRVTAAERLASIVQRAHALTNASGAATAIRQDHTSNFVCRASSGSSAPEVGTPLRLEGTLTGMCIQSGKELVCDDAETDSRVDTSAIRAQGIRSIAVTPIKEDRRVIGVLAVFSPKPHAFTPPLVGVLNALADQITGLLRKERRAKEEKRIEPALSLAKPSASSAPPALIVRTPAELPVAPKTPEREEPATVSTPADPKDESIWAKPGASAIAPAMQVPEEAGKHEQKGTELTPPDQSRPEPAWEQVVFSIRADLKTADAIPGKPVRPRPDKLIVTGAIIALLTLAGSIIVLLKMWSRSSAIPVQSSQLQESSALSVSPAQVASDSAPRSGEALSGAKPESIAKSLSENKRSEGTGKTEQRRKSVPAITATVTHSDSRITMPSASSQNESQHNIALTSGLGSNSASDLTLLARPVSSSRPGMAAQSELINARVIHSVPVLYPNFAKARRIVGTVILIVTVKKDGKVTNPRVTSGPGILRIAALDAVKQWRFKPAMLNGEPIEQDTEITLNFKP